MGTSQDKRLAPRVLISSIVTESLHADHMVWAVGLYDVFVVQKIVEVMTLIVLQNIISHADLFPFSKATSC